jgi:hypothetical protein
LALRARQRVRKFERKEFWRDKFNGIDAKIIAKDECLVGVRLTNEPLEGDL